MLIALEAIIGISLIGLSIYLGIGVKNIHRSISREEKWKFDNKYLDGKKEWEKSDVDDEIKRYIESDHSIKTEKAEK